MTVIKRFWDKLKTQPDIWFFYGFLLTFVFSVRKVINYFPIQGTEERTFNEYSAIFIYISDIFLFLTILSWIILILSNNNNLLSIFKLWITSYFHKLYNKILLESKFLFYNQSKLDKLSRNRTNSDSFVSIAQISNSKFKSFPACSVECSTWNTFYRIEYFGRLQSGILIILPLILILWSFISIAWSQNQNIAIFRSIKLLEYYFLYLYIIYRMIPLAIKRCSIWNIFIWIILFFGLFESITGIIQFTIQHSIGLFWLKESLISPNIDGVAKVIINGHKYIRAYGLFPHPNILGGFLLFSIVLTLLYKQIVPHLPRRVFHVEHSLLSGTYLNILVAIQSLALLLTFSKSAIFGLSFALLYIYFPRRSNKHLMFHVEQYTHSPLQKEGLSEIHSLQASARKTDESLDVPRGTSIITLPFNTNFRVIVLILLILLFATYLSWSNISYMVYNSVYQRIIYLNVSRGTILSNPILGVGIGQFVLNMPTFYGNLEIWQFQPVHDVFLLMWSELGIVGLVLFIYWLCKMFHVKQIVPYYFQEEDTRGTDGNWNVPRGTISREVSSLEKSISKNNYHFLSSIIILYYFKGILLGFLFIMLFDHYLWDIQQGSFLFWMIAGLILGIDLLKRQGNI